MAIPKLDKDDRLRLLDVGQYRMWNDAGDILIPIGQSTTKPLTTEKVSYGLKAYGEIRKGVFQSPHVDVTNRFPNPKRFDVFRLSIYRDFNPNPEPGDGSLPFDDPSIDYHDDLGLTAITAKVSIVFDCDGFQGSYDNDVLFRWTDDGVWMSETLEFNDYEVNSLVGKFHLFTNQYAKNLPNRGLEVNTAQFLQEVNLPIFCRIERARLINGDSGQDLLLWNTPTWPLFIYSVSVTLIRGANHG